MFLQGIYMGEINGKIAYANKIQIVQQLYNFSVN